MERSVEIMFKKIIVILALLALVGCTVKIVSVDVESQGDLKGTVELVKTAGDQMSADGKGELSIPLLK